MHLLHSSIRLIRFLCLSLVIAQHALPAQTDYVYMISRNQPKNLHSLVMNSNGYRELPNSPYVLEYFEDDLNPLFQSSVIVAEPGPFLYVGRIFPDQIYGFYRHIDGQLELLPGFPINVPSLSDPDRGRGGLVWMKKHPYLPIFYSVHALDGLIRAWEIQASGALLELPSSPIQIAPFFAVLQGMDLTKDGQYFYLSTFYGQIVRGRLDLQSGDFIDASNHHQTDEEGRAMLLSEDDRYLYSSVAFSHRIKRFRVLENSLEELLPEFAMDHDVTWLWRQQNLIISGAVRQTLASALLIQDDGGLVHGENSPFFVYSLNIDYAAFSPRGDRVYLAGNTFQHAYDIGPNGRMDYVPQSGYAVDSTTYGISVAPELRGDPNLLSLHAPQNTEPYYRIEGQPRTPFYLRINGDCQGPFETDDQGSFISQVPFQPDLQLEIVAYCQDEGAVARVQTVPTLSGAAKWLGLLCLTLMALYLNRKHRLGVNHA